MPPMAWLLTQEEAGILRLGLAITPLAVGVVQVMVKLTVPVALAPVWSLTCTTSVCVP